MASAASSASAASAAFSLASCEFSVLSSPILNMDDAAKLFTNVSGDLIGAVLGFPGLLFPEPQKDEPQKDKNEEETSQNCDEPQKDENEAETIPPCEEITGVPSSKDVVFDILQGHFDGLGITDNTVVFGDHSDLQYPSLGAPAALVTSGVLYWEFAIEDDPGETMILNVGFTLKDGIEQTKTYPSISGTGDQGEHAGCGDSGASWGLDVRRCRKYHSCHFVTWPCKKWTNGDVLGLAANVDEGSIAVSINGDWEGEACGIAFEDDKIKDGVYPCLSCSLDGTTLLRCSCSLKSEDWKHAPPGAGVWTMVKSSPLTLHDTIAWGKGAAVIDAFIKQAPEAVKETGEGGMMPLHWAALSRNDEAIATLIRAYSDGASKEDEKGYLPLHLALCRNRKKNANGKVIVPDGSGTCSGQTIAVLLRAYTPAAEMKCVWEADEDGLLPLHYACKTNAKIGVVKALLNVFPQAVTETGGGMMPLHWAALRRNNEVIATLITAYPDGASKKCKMDDIYDREGYLPLHLALCRNRKKNTNGKVIVPDGSGTCSGQTIAVLLRAYPPAAEMKCVWEADEDGLLPLHYACKTNAKIEVVKALLKANVKAVKEAAKDGWLPLHYACAHNENKDIVEALLKEFPKAAEKTTYLGKLPLDVTASSGQKRLRTWGSCLWTEKTTYLGKLPLELALGTANTEVVATLIMACPSDEIFDLLQVKFPNYEHLNKLLDQPVFELAANVLRSKQPFRSALFLSSVFFRLSRQQRSTDTLVSRKADERAAEMLQLAGAVARYLCHFYDSDDRKDDALRKDLDACLEFVVDHGLKAIVGEPDFARVVRKLWFGNAVEDLKVRIEFLFGFINPFREQIICGLKDFNGILQFLCYVLLVLLLLAPFLFLVLFAALTFAWPPVWRFWLNRLAYLTFCVIAYRLPKQIKAGAEITSARLELAAAVLLFSLIWEEVAQFTRIFRKNSRRAIAQAELLAEIKAVGVKVDKTLESDAIIIPHDSDLRAAINEIKEILRDLDIKNSPLGMTAKNAAKITAAGDKVDTALKPPPPPPSPPISPDLAHVISELQNATAKFKESNTIRHRSRALLHLVKKALSRYTNDIWNIWDVLVSLSALAAAVARGCLFMRVGNITPTAAEDLYMISLWMAWMRLVTVLRVSRSVGPLLRIFEVMIVKDVRVFIILMFAVALPFVATLSHRFGESEDGVGVLEDYQTFGSSFWTFMKMFVGNGPDLDDSNEESEMYHLTHETYYLGSPASAIVWVGYFVLVIAMANLLIAVRLAL
jgi:ankyrin repeat protein